MSIVEQSYAVVELIARQCHCDNSNWESDILEAQSHRLISAIYIYEYILWISVFGTDLPISARHWSGTPGRRCRSLPTLDRRLVVYQVLGPNGPITIIIDTISDTYNIGIYLYYIGL